MRTIRRVAALVSVLIGVLITFFATYYSMMIKPNSESPARPYVRSSPVVPPMLTIEHLTQLNEEIKPTKSSIAPSDLDELNSVIAHNWVAADFNSIGELAHFDVSTLNARFADAGSHSRLLTANFAAVNDIVQEAAVQQVGYLHATRPQFAPPRSRPEPTWIDKLFSGLTEQFRNNPAALILPLLIGLLYYVVTIAGILANSIYDALDARKSKAPIAPREVFASALSATGWQGIMFSPFIFGLILGPMQTTGVSYSMILLAFQNGFFWRGTLKKVAEKFGEPTKPTPKAKDKKNKKP